MYPYAVLNAKALSTFAKNPLKWQGTGGFFNQEALRLRRQQLWETTVRTWIKCTDANGQIIHVNLHNATTLFRDEVRHRGTIIGFIGPTDALTVRETPDEILKAAEG